MSVAFAAPVLVRPTADARAGRPAPAPTRATPRRPGPGVGPTARPRRLRFTAPGRVRPVRPGPGTGPAAAPRRLRFTAPPTNAARAACSPVPPVVRMAQPRARRSGWWLTERGLAVVLVLAAALVAASVAVVALTAVRVTGATYHPAHPSSAPVVLVQD